MTQNKEIMQKINQQECFDGFVDEIVENVKVTDYYLGRLIARFVNKIGDYSQDG